MAYEKIINVNNCKIVIPNFNFLTENDIYISMGLNRQMMYLFNEYDFNLYVKKVLKFFDELLELGKIDNKKYRYYLRCFFSKFCLEQKNINKRREIILPKYGLELLNAKNSVFVIEEDNHLEIYKDEDMYKLLKK